MKTLLTVLIAVATAVPAAGQQKLGEVAGSIKLKKSEGEAVVIDDSGMARSRAVGASSGAAEDLLRVTEAASETAGDVAAYIGKMPWVEPLTYEDAVRTRLEEWRFELDEAATSLQLFFDLEQHRSAVEGAVQGLADVRGGLADTLLSVSRYQVVPTAVRERTANGARQLRDALGRMRAVARTSTATATAAPIDPIAADATMRVLCGERFADGSDSHGECLSQQQAAVDSLLLRSGAAAGVDDATFNRIRNECLLEWPRDYVTRDRCEQRRLASAGGR